ncbi:MAG: signal peptidase I [Bdellovibrionales bacterium]|nr:signal peptidase I [Bdellovibrionales bacterium]
MNKDSAIKKYRRIFLSEFAEAILAAIVVAVVLRVFFVAVYRVPTESMQPSLIPGDFIVAWKTSYGVPVPFSSSQKWGERLPERGDVVVFTLPGEDALFVKRVIGLPGDRVAIENGKIRLNEVTVTADPSTETDQNSGVLLATESTGKSTHVVMRRSDVADADFFAPIVVPPGEVFVLGDFRSESVDSRQWGTVPVSSIEGRVARVAFSLELENGRTNQPVAGGDLKAGHGGELRPTGRIRWDRIFHRVE